MSAATLTVKKQATGQWVILGDCPTTISPTKAAAVAWAVDRLQARSGGVVNVLLADGHPDYTRDVAAASEDDRQAELEQHISNAAEAADKVIGRESRTDPNLPEEFGNLTINELIPESLIDNRHIRIVNQHMSAGAAWAGLILAVAGGGTIAGFVTPLLQVSSGGATIIVYINFIKAFIATFAMCVAIGASWLAYKNGVKGFPLLSCFVLGSIAACAIAINLGLGGPAPIDLLHAQGQSPPESALRFIWVYLQVYGPVPFLTGAGIGFISGNLVHELSRSNSQ